MLASAGKEKRASGQSTTGGPSPGEPGEKDTPAKAKTPVDPKVAAALEHAKQHGGAKDANAANDAKAPTAAGEPTKPKSHVEHGQVWVKDGLLAKPVKVQIGVTDGIDTEISGPGIEEGTEVIIGEATPDQASRHEQPLRAQTASTESGGPPKARP